MVRTPGLGQASERLGGSVPGAKWEWDSAPGCLGRPLAPDNSRLNGRSGTQVGIGPGQAWDSAGMGAPRQTRAGGIRAGGIRAGGIWAGGIWA